MTKSINKKYAAMLMAPMARGGVAPSPLRVQVMMVASILPAMFYFIGYYLLLSSLWGG